MYQGVLGQAAQASAAPCPVWVDSLAEAILVVNSHNCHKSNVDVVACQALHVG
jgi:hypothetical protein